ncbi:hypothetical protein Mp_2g14290 [Marchantia polymorpha subsp. ruderalis]|uniref:Uncharacterized protein n=1 Tax=Marchantia polymorpha TaxID=3197 RepID=A0A2R6X1N7_MARPO|nr:hypothetical protein MARPO_0042s0056 [Marchantia polymorpha]BBN02316.1 hypothetical protein Mp_2g14290 [Marchantia polymorpha subsp. ruderalis]PTQ40016.1 hypothetical protein MARPO_0042s0056 [Marchantia polymorpha]PTQ40017.1 hypothetical protein MARPO_0042s0056 [Marchantia polymorpha]BBN02317.1 hypothetical protein Mp_2g14290 [Marchantia polymorpha subsp. ruderalis]|eukprot:PTQ40015.1 hypothetical protein MARPO_0042s0056 [Marchantia polymorpha]
MVHSWHEINFEPSLLEISPECAIDYNLEEIGKLSGLARDERPQRATASRCESPRPGAARNVNVRETRESRTTEASNRRGRRRQNRDRKKSSVQAQSEKSLRDLGVDFSGSYSAFSKGFASARPIRGYQYRVRPLTSRYLQPRPGTPPTPSRSSADMTDRYGRRALVSARGRILLLIPFWPACDSRAKSGTRTCATPRLPARPVAAGPVHREPRGAGTSSRVLALRQDAVNATFVQLAILALWRACGSLRATSLSLGLLRHLSLASGFFSP